MSTDESQISLMLAFMNLYLLQQTSAKQPAIGKMHTAATYTQSVTYTGTPGHAKNTEANPDTERRLYNKTKSTSLLLNS